MKKKNSGFMIVELLLSIFLAGIILAIASSMPLNMIKLGAKFNFIFNQNLNITNFHNQVEKDLLSAFSANIFSLEEIKKEELNSEPEKKDNPISEPKSDEKTKKSVDEELKPEKIIFVSQNHGDNNLDFMAFLSTNKFQMEIGDKPLFTGIAYFAEQNKNETYDFFRAEFSDYNFDFSKKDLLINKIEKKYLLLKNIEKLELTYFSKNEKDEKLESKNWPLNQDSKNNKNLQLPNFIKIKLAMIENKIKNEFEFSIPIFNQINVTKSKNAEIEKKEPENNGSSAGDGNEV